MGEGSWREEDWREREREEKEMMRKIWKGRNMEGLTRDKKDKLEG